MDNFTPMSLKTYEEIRRITDTLSQKIKGYEKRKAIAEFLEQNDARALHSDIRDLIDYILISEEEDFEENPSDRHIYAIAKRLADTFDHYLIPGDALADFKGDL